MKRILARSAPALAAVGLSIVLTSAAVATAWDPRHVVTTGGSVITGGALERTIASGATYLHAVWNGSINGIPGVQYGRSANDGQTWTNRVGLTGSVLLRGEPSLATSGSNVYATWARMYGATDSAVSFRRNTKHGAVLSWLPSKQLTLSTGRVSEPSIAASGSAVYIAYTNLATAEIRLLISRDRGETWIRRSMAGGVSAPAKARAVVAAAGDNVAVFWLENGDILKSRESTDKGGTWTPPPDEEYALGEGLSSAAALGDRFAVAGTGDAGEAFVRIWEDGVWGFANSIPDHQLGTNPDADQDDVAVVLRGTNQVAVAYAARDQATHIEAIVWVTSPDGGEHWAADETVSPTFVPSDPRAVSDPSVLYRSTGDVYILWDQGTGAGRSSVVIRHGH